MTDIREEKAAQLLEQAHAVRHEINQFKEAHELTWRFRSKYYLLRDEERTLLDAAWHIRQAAKFARQTLSQIGG